MNGPKEKQIKPAKKNWNISPYFEHTETSNNMVNKKIQAQMMHSEEWNLS